LILAAEVYENQAPAAEEHIHDTAVAPHSHDEAWAPQDGVERITYTVLANVLASLGFTLVLAAVSVLAGLPITARNGVVWGLGGFIVFHLAPAFGLPPELPGMPAADLVARQIWWWGTVLATAAALLGMAKLQNATAIGIGALLIIAPHILGAPATPHEPSAVTAHLATTFAASTLATSAVFWLAVGPLLGWLNERFARADQALAQKKEAHA
jgi:cobalt transporter subunit CbtA